MKDPYLNHLFSKPDSWEEAYWRARLYRYYAVYGGWRTDAPVRQKTRAKAIFYMYKKGWYRNSWFEWEPRNKETEPIVRKQGKG